VAYPNGNNPMEDWYRGLSDDGRLLFDGLLKNTLGTGNPEQWLWFKRFLRGRFRKERIWEGWFYADGRQNRVLAKFGPARKQVLLLTGCYHKQRVYHPPDALDTAFRIARAWREGKMVLREREVRTDR
jgi:hypothetical protein